jgi:hypothetical protein
MCSATAQRNNVVTLARQLTVLVILVWLSMSVSNAAMGTPPPGALSDDDLANLPEDLQNLSLRGPHGYGIDQITDAGFVHIERLQNLRVLHAGGLNLTDQVLQSLSKLPHLEELSLDSNALTGAGLEQLVALKKLRKLNLNFNPLGASSFEALSQLTNLTQLEVVNREPIDDETLQLCSRLTQLETLRLNSKANGVSNRGLAAVAKLTRLKNFSLEEATVTGEGLHAIRALKHLQHLELKTLPQVPPGSLTWLPELTELRDLEIAQVRLNQLDMAAVNKLSELERLLLWNVFPSAAQPLAIEQLNGIPSVRQIRTNEIISRSAIRDMCKMEGLESITDELTRITDEELRLLAELPNLHTLCLGSEQVTNRSLSALARMKSLRVLFVTKEVQLTASELTDLGKGALPECLIQLMYPPYTVFHKPSSK